ncbi:MAG: hypothetical protein FWD34_08625 [Oscillospiraceae bacterium]|nr:hypothetical protein [Oscillospiraceae bacterium]
MKIEMGESIFYSWLRHVKECQIVQTNWKASLSWQLQNEDKLNHLMSVTDDFFKNKYNYEIFKNNSLSQLLKQAELDAIGTYISESGIEIHVVDVAFHEGGLLYGGKEETAMRVTKKLIRAALCLIGYFNIFEGDIIFASPKINNSAMEVLEPCISDLNKLLHDNGYDFKGRVIANEDFKELVLTPILIASDGVSDTSELFMRGYQLVKMFGDDRPTRKRTVKTTDNNAVSNDSLSELKIGKIAQTLLRETLESGKVSEDEIHLMQTKEYSKKVFDIQYPLLYKPDSVNEVSPARYYSIPLRIKGVVYYLCREWFEVPANNDRPFLLKWLELHGAI